MERDLMDVVKEAKEDADVSLCAAIADCLAAGFSEANIRETVEFELKRHGS